MASDVVIRGGTIIDGTGLAPFPADVAISDGRIAAVGRVRDQGATEIDAEGMAVTPGFIDGHTHMDAQVFWDELGTNSCWHGVTTVVMGHCGFTLAPSRDDQRELVVRNLERAEDIAPEALAAGIDWSWTTFAEYLDALDRVPKGINYAANIGHSALRTYVMGERAFVEPASDDDVTAMRHELADALRAGAYGFTTSRTRHHQTSDDRPVASRLASWEEVERLVEVLGELGSGIFQITTEPSTAGEEHRMQDIQALSVRTGVPVSIGAMTRRSLARLDRANAAGARIWGVTHPRGIGAFSSFRTQLPFDRLPEWRDLRALPIDEQRRRLEAPELVARLVRIADDGPYPDAVGGEARPPRFDRMQVFDTAVPPHRTVAEVAAERAVHPVQLMIDLSLQTDMRQLFWQHFEPFDDDEAIQCLRHPTTVMGFSDSGAHVSQMADASIETHLLAYLVRDRQAVSLEEAVRMLTLEPARMYGFSDRGLVREGLVADLNVFDPDRVAPSLPEVVHDLPGGAPRLSQRSVGIEATIVGGEVLISGGEPTDARPGRLLRRRVASA
jgi:N-acyl-D-aspartate/D-glutamate deacylase